MRRTDHHHHRQRRTLEPITLNINAHDSVPPNIATTTSESDEVAEFAKRCPGYPELATTIPAKPRIVAIGDTHGDWKTTLKLLQLGQLITIDTEGEPHWSANPPDTVVVQLGDQIDRCRPAPGLPCQPSNTDAGSSSSSEHSDNHDEASDIRILNMFSRLDREARAVGGAVYSLFGNHELMNIQGDFNYVSRANLKEIGHSDRLRLFQPGGAIGKDLACTRQGVLIIGDILFVHGGIIPDYLHHMEAFDGRLTGRRALRWLNRQIRQWLLGIADDPTNLLSIINSTKISPFWVRILGKIPSHQPAHIPQCTQIVQPVLATLKVGAMVIGHTPQSEDANGLVANTTCGDTLIRTDIGASHAFAAIDKRSQRPIQIVEFKMRSPDVGGWDVRILT